MNISPPPAPLNYLIPRNQSLRAQLNPDLQSPQERERFRSLVGVLLSCGLTFAPQSAGASGGGTQGNSSTGYGAFQGALVQEFALEPAVDQV